MTILIVEDDKHTREALREIMESEGFDVLCADTGKKGLELFQSQKPDLLCLDVMMPEMDGYSLCRKIREQDSEVPVLFISAKSEEIDRVLGLELGADDFISKPFGVQEVLARIRAILRRTRKEQDTLEKPFEMLNLKIDPQGRRAFRDGICIDLSARDIFRACPKTTNFEGLQLTCRS